MATNISSGNFQSYDPGEGIRIFQALDADIILIQEFNYLNNSDADLDNFVADTFGNEFTYVEEGKSSGQIQNGVISRYPILQSGVWDDDDMTDREFVWAQIDVPGETNLWVISVHFKASSGSETRRTGQAEQLAGYINANVPSADHLVIGGDFNAQDRNEEFLTKLSPLVEVAGPWPVDKNGNSNTNSGRSKPYDWVMVEPALAALEVPTILGTRTYTNGLVFDSRVYTPITDIPPVLSTDSGVQGMQHMAVMKTFDLPVDLYLSWLDENFPTRPLTTELSTWGKTADPDKDGLVNLLEYATGRDPNQASSSPPILTVNLDGPNLIITFPTLAESSLTYQIEGSSDLTNFTPLTGASTTESDLTDLIKMRTLTAPQSDQRFFRLKINDSP